MNVLSKGSGNKVCRPWAITLQEFPQVWRPLDVAVISDLHLGMRGCRAAEVLACPKVHGLQILVLKGDIVDVGQLSQKHVQPEHMLVAWKLIDVVSSSAELRSTREFFQALLVELSEG